MLARADFPCPGHAVAAKACEQQSEEALVPQGLIASATAR